MTCGLSIGAVAISGTLVTAVESSAAAPRTLHSAEADHCSRSGKVSRDPRLLLGLRDWAYPRVNPLLSYDANCFFDWMDRELEDTPPRKIAAVATGGQNP